jgi:hypothetical protein
MSCQVKWSFSKKSTCQKPACQKVHLPKYHFPKSINQSILAIFMYELIFWQIDYLVGGLSGSWPFLFQNGFEDLLNGRGSAVNRMLDGSTYPS